MTTFTGISSSNTQPNDQPSFFFFKPYCQYLLINYTSILNTSLPPFCVCVWGFFCLFVCFLFFCHCLSYLCVLLYDILLLHELFTFFSSFFFFFLPNCCFLDSPYLVPYMIHTFHHLKLWFK